MAVDETRFDRGGIVTLGSEYRSRRRKVARTRPPVLAVVGRLAAGVVNLVDRMRAATLSLLGFGFLCAAAWVSFGRGAGMAAVGLSLLVLELLTREERG